MSVQFNAPTSITPKVILTQTQSNLLAKISPASLDNQFVAFYLFHNNQRVETTGYSRNSTVRFSSALQTGTYFCVAYFKKNSKSEITRARSNNHHIHYNTSSTSPIDSGQSSPCLQKNLEYISYFSSITVGSYADFKKNGFKARANYPAIHIKNPVRFDNIDDLNVEYVMNGWRFLNPIWNEYIATGDEVLIHEIMSYMNDWNLYRLRSKRNYAVWNDMMTGIRAMHLALLTYIVSAHSIKLTEGQEIRLKKLQDVHLYKLSQPDWIRLNNHGMWQLLGLRLLCWSLNDTHQESLQICYKRVKELLDFTFDEEGVNTENSPFYHGYSANLINCLPRDLFKESAEHISTITTNARTISAWLTDPHGIYFNIGDTEGKGASFSKNYAFEKSKTISNQVFVQKFYKQGYAIVRTIPGTEAASSHSLIFYGTNRNVTHGHADKLAFILFHKGIEIFTDSGKFIYEYGQWQDYFISDKAHNVLGITGQQFGPRDVSLTDTCLNDIQASGAGFVFTGTTEYVNEQFGYSRTLRYIPGVELTITDDVLIRPSSTLEHRFQLGVGVSAKILGNNQILLVHADTLIGYLQIDSKALDCRVICGSESPITGWCSKVYKRKDPIDSIIITYPEDSTHLETKINFIS